MEVGRLRVERRLHVAPSGTEVFVGTWRLKDEDEERLRQNDPEASTTRQVAIKILSGIQLSPPNKLEKERMLAKKREASVLKRLARLQLPFLIELEAILKIEDWPAAKQQLLAHVGEGSTGMEKEAQEIGDADVKSDFVNIESLAGGDVDEEIGDEAKENEQRKEAVGNEAYEAAIILVMAYHEQSLFDYLERHSSKDQGLTLPEALIILKQMATAIAHCHRHTICHRDVKLENFLWDERKREVRLIDFGSCGMIRHAKLFSRPCGSLSYLAPEVVQGKGYNESVDVWALGVTFYALLTGRFPFGGGSKTADRPADVFQRIVHQRLSLPDYVPAAVDDLVRRMLCRDRKRRISAEEILTHTALTAVSTSMEDLDRMERERRRREKGKEKLNEEEEDDNSSSIIAIANNNNNDGRGIKRVRNEEASAW